MKREVYYVKRGRKYVPVGVDFPDIAEQGIHLVVVNKGMKSYRYNIPPEKAMLEAICALASDRIAKVVMEYNEKSLELRNEGMRESPEAAERHRKAFEEYKRATQQDEMWLTRPAAAHAAGEIVRLLSELKDEL